DAAVRARGPLGRCDRARGRAGRGRERATHHRDRRRIVKYRCQFERIGRNRDVPPLDVESDDAAEIAYNVYTYSRRFLTSNDVFVTVDLDALRGWINAGRFGTFTLDAAV